MDFFHCNYCYLQPGPPQNRKFWLTNCGHSFCSKCADTNNSKCRSCMNECKYLPINNDMPESLKLFFSDRSKELQRTLKILMMQNKHCKMFMEEYIPKLESKYAQAKMVIENNKSDLNKAKKTLQNKEAEIQSLRSHIEKLKAELDDVGKKYAALQQLEMGKYSPTLHSSPSSFDSNQEVFYTPKSCPSKLANSSYNFVDRKSSNTFTPHSTPSPPGSEKKKLTAMELLFKKKEAAVRNSQCDRTPRTPNVRSNQAFNMSINVTPPSRNNQHDRVPLTPNVRSNQAFNMSVNVTPPSSYNSDDSQESFSDAQRMPSPMEIKMRQYQGLSSEPNLHRRNTGMMTNMSSASPFKSRYFQRTGSGMERNFFQK